MGLVGDDGEDEGKFFGSTRTRAHLFWRAAERRKDSKVPTKLGRRDSSGSGVSSSGRVAGVVGETRRGRRGGGAGMEGMETRRGVVGSSAEARGGLGDDGTLREGSERGGVISASSGSMTREVELVSGW